jgi:hypothetical protein
MPWPGEIADGDSMATFIVENSKFTRDGIDHRQLMPSNRYGNTSVFRIDGLGADEIAQVGHGEVALPRAKPGILGWAELQAADVRSTTPLTVNPDEPPSRHAVIESWPAQPQHRRTLALALASKVRAVVRRSTAP